MKKLDLRNANSKETTKLSSRGVDGGNTSRKNGSVEAVGKGSEAHF